MKIYDLTKKAGHFVQNYLWRKKGGLISTAPEGVGPWIARVAKGVATKISGLFAGATVLEIAGLVVTLAVAFYAVDKFLVHMNLANESSGIAAHAERVYNEVANRLKTEYADRGEDIRVEKKRIAKREDFGLYYVIHVTGAVRGILSVRGGSHFSEQGEILRPFYLDDFRHGGIKRVRAGVEVLGVGYSSPDKATQALANYIVNNSMYYRANGYVGRTNMGEKTIDDWGLVNFQILRDAGKYR